MPAPVTVDQIRGQIADTRAYLDEAEARVRSLAARRRDALVSGSTDTVIEAETEQKKAEVDAERARVRLEALEDRLAQATATERRAKREADRQETLDLIRRKLALAEEVDAAVSVLADLARRRRELDAEIRRRWLGHAAEYGEYTPPTLHDFLALRAALPHDLARELGVREGNGTPLAQGDVALHARARLEGEVEAPTVPTVRRAPEGSGVAVHHSTPGGVSLVRQPAGT